MRWHRYFKVEDDGIIWTWRMNVAPETWTDTASVDEIRKETEMNLIEEINKDEYDELMKMDDEEMAAFEKWMSDKGLNPNVCSESLRCQFHYFINNR